MSYTMNDKRGYLYFVTFSDGSAKVGYSANDPEARVSAAKHSANAFGVDTEDVRISERLGNALEAERELIAWARTHGVPRTKEYFAEIDPVSLDEAFTAICSTFLEDPSDFREAEHDRAVAQYSDVRRAILRQDTAALSDYMTQRSILAGRLTRAYMASAASAGLQYREDQDEESYIDALASALEHLTDLLTEEIEKIGFSDDPRHDAVLAALRVDEEIFADCI